MEVVEVKEIRHGNENRYFLFYKFNTSLNDVARTITGCRYSKSYRAWHVTANRESIDWVREKFKGKAWVDTKHIHANALVLGSTPTAERIDELKPAVRKVEVLPPLDEEKLLQLEEFKKYLRARRYSESTVTTYSDGVVIFLRYYNLKCVTEIDNTDLVNFNNDYIIRNNLSAAYQNQIINGVKLFFRICGGTKMDAQLIYRPKSAKLLPNVLSKEEVKWILNAPANLKHKAMLSLIYSCGLRCGELLRLKPGNVDSKRGLLIVKQSKGRKDRVVPLSAKIVELLRQYFIAFKPKKFLFEGQSEGEMYDERSLQNVLKQCLAKTEIRKPVTLHWLRHSYATHLLENGTDLRYIQEILGHSSSKTTEIYTHVSTKNIQNITSPFDYL